MKENKQTFNCINCKQNFIIKLVRLVNKDNNKTCRNCLREMLAKANLLSGEEIVLRKKKKEENASETQASSSDKKEKIFNCATCQDKYSGEPHLVHVSNYQNQGIIPQQLVKICSECLENKVEIANLYCPRTSEGKDTWNPKEAQFDCYCPTRINNPHGRT